MQIHKGHTIHSNLIWNYMQNVCWYVINWVPVIKIKIDLMLSTPHQILYCTSLILLKFKSSSLEFSLTCQRSEERIHCLYRNCCKLTFKMSCICKSNHIHIFQSKVAATNQLLISTLIQVDCPVQQFWHWDNTTSGHHNIIHRIFL